MTSLMSSASAGAISESLLLLSDGKTGGGLLGVGKAGGGFLGDGNTGGGLLGVSRGTKNGGAFFGTLATTCAAFFGTSIPRGGLFQGG